ASLLACFLGNPINKSLMTAALIAVSFLLAHRTYAVEQAKEEARQLRDDSYEMSLLFKEKNRELIAKQNYELRLATLNERGRIAREIHDHVGHLLSRSILQVGAFMAINRSEEVRQNLSTIRATLTEAMNRIRTSVHDLHDETLDFRTRVEALVNGFTFCPLRLHYRLEIEPEQDIGYCFLAVIKEGLNNILRHSNATRVTLLLLEHPALYQLVLQDNGSPPARDKPGKGLGLRSMDHRVSALEGKLVIEQAGGYRLFISIPKRRPEHESANC
ncbi:MAG: sensor histidine kinase, partial [Dethiobacteria bacterium]